MDTTFYRQFNNRATTANTFEKLQKVLCDYFYALAVDASLKEAEEKALDDHMDKLVEEDLALTHGDRR